MSVDQLEIDAQAGGYVLSGEINRRNATQVLHDYPALSGEQGRIDVDVSGLTTIDSVGLSVLLHWARACQQQDQKMILQSVPPQLDSMLHIAGLSDLFKDS